MSDKRERKQKHLPWFLWFDILHVLIFLLNPYNHINQKIQTTWFSPLDFGVWTFDFCVIHLGIKWDGWGRPICMVFYTMLSPAVAATSVAHHNRDDNGSALTAPIRGGFGSVLVGFNSGKGGFRVLVMPRPHFFVFNLYIAE